MTDKRSIEDALSLLGYTDYRIHEALLDVFYILDAKNFDAEEKERVLSIGLELVSQKITQEIPSNPKWVPFRQGQDRPGAIARVKSEGYVGKASWHLGKVGHISAIRGGRVILQYIGRSDGVGHYHHQDMIEVLDNG